jgi:hypothetical protein
LALACGLSVKVPATAGRGLWIAPQASLLRLS